MPKVVMYTDPNCGFCNGAKQYLGEHSVEYTDHDVTSSKEAFDELERLSGQHGVPFIIIGEGGEEEYVIGYDRPKLATLLSIPE